MVVVEKGGGKGGGGREGEGRRKPNRSDVDAKERGKHGGSGGSAGVLRADNIVRM